jgi:hypothetical protein
MTHLDRRPPKLDADLDRQWRSSGRLPLGAALVTFIGAALAWAIGKTSGGALSQADYVALALIASVISPTLAALGGDYRARMLTHVQGKQIERDEIRALPRGRRNTTGKHTTIRRPRDPRDTEDGPL